MHKNLSFLIQNKQKVLYRISKHSKLEKYKQLITNTHLFQMHMNKFGPFKVNDIAKENPTLFRYKTYHEEEKEGMMIEYDESCDESSCWWGQEFGAYHVEIGLQSDDEEIYILEGDCNMFARMTILNIANKQISYRDFHEYAQDSIYNIILVDVVRMMTEHHPLYHVHEGLSGLTQNPDMMHDQISINHSANLYPQKDGIVSSDLLEKHYKYFGAFDVWTLVLKLKKLKV